MQFICPLIRNIFLINWFIGRWLDDPLKRPARFDRISINLELNYRYNFDHFARFLVSNDVSRRLKGKKEGKIKEINLKKTKERKNKDC